MKLNLKVDRKDKELGICTDGAAVNVKMHRRRNVGTYFMPHTQG